MLRVKKITRDSLNYEFPVDGRMSELSQHQRFSELVHKGLLAYCFFSALSIAVSQVIVVSLIAYWLIFTGVRLARGPASSVLTDYQREPCKQILFVVFCYLFFSYLAALVGIEPARALKETFKTTLYLLLPFVVYASFLTLEKNAGVGRIKSYLFILILSQFIAALHSLLSASFSVELAPKIPGPLTESGQIVLIFPALLGLILAGEDLTLVKQRIASWGPAVPELIYGSLLFLLCLCFSWPGELSSLIGVSTPNLVRMCSLLGLFVLLAGTYCSDANLFSRPRFRLLLAGVALLSALVVNLKRGPWFGLCLALGVFAYLSQRKLVLRALLLVILICVLAEPVRSRLSDWLDHFSISGGRQNMWSLGVDLVERYPLGLGPDNANFMRELDASLPETHRHMHNNILNVVVESGWLGAVAYLTWMYLLIVLGFRLWKIMGPDKAGFLPLGLSCGLLAWQLAGLVEYNFGDGEIRLIALFYMGLLLGLSKELGPSILNTKTTDA